MVKVTPIDIEPYLLLIESQPRINDRFVNIKRIDSKGGNGFFSLVFNAYDEITKRDVILKFYHPLKLSDLDRLRRFHREGEILKKLIGQQNILQCIDGICILPIQLSSSGILINQEYFFIPTEKAKASVEEFIYSSHLTPLDCLYCLREMCKGVARLHAKKICHRDLKPSNFFYFNKEDIKVGDFGTAKFLDGSMPDIRSSYIQPVGDLDYIAPELICEIGVSDDLSYGSDIFSLGAILFEMFSKEILSSHIYTPELLGELITVRSVVSRMSFKDKLIVYSGSINSIASGTKWPNIFSFNDFVPPSIKYHLNSLYLDMCQFNLNKRLRNFTAIYRRINICILILRNEVKYKNRIRQKKSIRGLNI